MNWMKIPAVVGCSANVALHSRFVFFSSTCGFRFVSTNTNQMNFWYPFMVLWKKKIPILYFYAHRRANSPQKIAFYTIGSTNGLLAQYLTWTNKKCNENGLSFRNDVFILHYLLNLEHAFQQSATNLAVLFVEQLKTELFKGSEMYFRAAANIWQLLLTHPFPISYLVVSGALLLRTQTYGVKKCKFVIFIHNVPLSQLKISTMYRIARISNDLYLFDIVLFFFLHPWFCYYKMLTHLQPGKLKNDVKEPINNIIVVIMVFDGVYDPLTHRFFFFSFSNHRDDMVESMGSPQY